MTSFQTAVASVFGSPEDPADVRAATIKRSLDWMVAAVAVLCCLGLVLAVSIGGVKEKVGPVLAMKSHGGKLAVGLVAFLVAAMLPLSLLWKHARMLFLGSAGLVYLARFIGPDRNGAHRWIEIGGRFTFQPIDLARICCVVLVARLIAEHQDELRDFRRGTLRILAPAMILVGGLVLQPDNGNAMFILALCSCMALVAGVRIYHFALVAAAGLVGVIAIALQRPYVIARLTGFLEPEVGGQVYQSKVAIAAGGLTGAGLGNGWMKMGFVPEAHNDFLFAVIGEELGLLGGVLVLGLFGTFAFMGLRLVRCVQDRFLRTLILGLCVALCMQAAINLLVVTGMAPAKGIDLPFLSSGGTSLVTCLAAVGLIGNAARVDARLNCRSK